VFKGSNLTKKIHPLKTYEFVRECVRERELGL